MRTSFIGLAAIVGLAGCGASGAANGSAAQTAACAAVTNDMPANGVGDGTDPMGIGAMNWSTMGGVLTTSGYDTLAADVQRITSALQASDHQGALSALTQFNVDKAASNLAGC
ncbi:MAG: hypothetical protein DLM65_07720 [Candidatus Aeolococcus gillhamiae]|uniref:Uncharacterized protein n=1 Tax=Candidatus Aeolococcus gillhamiae TaxID=3127015 RepID=A0A2W5Z9D1_9BACT|nr:MAG: hypothetical protein DLM65_07720 [Candidatus Dormibacter sp. RRmetagenome_bin12]